MQTQVYNWLNSVHFRLLPAICLLCQGNGQPDREICPACEADLPWQARGCKRCALSLAPTAEAVLCRDCLTRPAPFYSAHAAFDYASPASDLIAGLKFRARLAHARLLAGLWLQHCGPRVERPDFLLPVPLHGRRERERGFNQAGEITRQLARHLNLPVKARAAIRNRATAVQSDLPAKARADNLRGAFQADQNQCRERHIAIVDDVVTTGSTSRELAGALLRAGATRVDLWCIARA